MTEQQFPDAEARVQIMARRNKLQRDLIEYMVARSPRKIHPRNS